MNSRCGAHISGHCYIQVILCLFSRLFIVLNEMKSDELNNLINDCKYKKVLTNQTTNYDEVYLLVIYQAFFIARNTFWYRRIINFRHLFLRYIRPSLKSKLKNMAYGCDHNYYSRSHKIRKTLTCLLTTASYR